MKHIQKLVLVPIERWEKIGNSIPCERSVSEISSSEGYSEECFSSEEDSCISGEESEIEKSTRMGEILTPETKSDVSFSHSRGEEESI